VEISRRDLDIKRPRGRGSQLQIRTFVTGLFDNLLISNDAEHGKESK
jgi:hypothetical protein